MGAQLSEMMPPFCFCKNHKPARENQLTGVVRGDSANSAQQQNPSPPKNFIPSLVRDSLPHPSACRHTPCVLVTPARDCPRNSETHQQRRCS